MVVGGGGGVFRCCQVSKKKGKVGEEGVVEGGRAFSWSSPFQLPASRLHRKLSNCSVKMSSSLFINFSGIRLVQQRTRLYAVMLGHGNQIHLLSMYCFFSNIFF